MDVPELPPIWAWTGALRLDPDPLLLFQLYAQATDDEGSP